MKKFLGNLILGPLTCNITLAQSSLPECEGNDIKNPLKKFAVAKKWTNCHGTMLTLKGKSGYVGEYYEGQPHGQGTFTYAGRKYVGEWKRGKQHGQGTYTYPNGDKYVGEWKKRKYNKPDNGRARNGMGTYTYANGDKYVGKWKKGLRHGKGIFTYASGKVEKGIWKKDKLVKSKK